MTTNRRIWTGILAGVVAATVLLGVAGAAYRAGRAHEVVTRTVGDGEVVRVIGGYGWGGPGWGHGGGYFLLPLLTILLVVLAFRAFRGGAGGYGPCGPGPDPRFEEHHRRAHERAATAPGERAEA